MHPTTLAEVLQRACSLENHGITFIEGGEQEIFVSYQKLYDRSLKGLYLLQKSGLKPQDELVFQIEDNQTFIILFWSCILGGIVPVPLSIGKNDDQKAKLFNVWGILNNPYLVCTSDHLEKITEFGLATSQDHLLARIKAKSIDLSALSATDKLGEAYQSKPTDLAFIQFSSGSTGSPKGVMLTHENLITNVAAIASAAEYNTTDSTLSWMPLTHDMGLIGFHINPVFSKMNQYLMPTSLFVRSPTIWLSKATEHKTTVICSPNFGYRYLLKYIDAGKEYAWDLSSIRIIYNGAEPISVELAQTFVKAMAKYGLYENAMRPVYGLAEASLAVSISELSAEMISLRLDRDRLNVGTEIQPAKTDKALSIVNVGTAINDVSLKITDEAGREIGEEVIGHVMIKGINVTAGYYNNPEATNKAISDNGWLDTGDLGFMKSGSLHITGRSKDVFFINGQNFYPHDLERVAEAVEGIELNKIVIAAPLSKAGAVEEVMAFVFHRGDLKRILPTIQALKAHINLVTGVELAQVIPVKDIPKTTSGKLQRFKMVERYKAGEYDSVLRELQLAQKAEMSLSSAKPQNITEQTLLDIWKGLFNRPGLSVTDRFFEIGGNSLKAAEFAMAVLRQYEVELPMAALYDHQTIREIAGLLDSLRKVEYAPIPKAPDSARHPASVLQRRLFYFQETNPDTTAYNVPVAFETNVNLQVEELRKAAKQMVEQYDILRSSFYEKDHELFIQVHDKVTLEIELVEGDISNPAFAASLITPFDLKKPVLFKLMLVSDKEGQKCLFFDFHHIIMDGISVSYFTEELIRLYQGSKMKISATQYTDFAHWSESQWHTDKYQVQRQYWLDQLEGELPLLEMPLDRPRPAQFDYAGKKLTYSISKSKAARLRAMATKHGCSMHSLMFTAYQVLLHKYTGQSELITGLPVTLRNHPDVSRSLGMFVNNLAIRHSIEPEESFEILLERLANQINEALTQEYPFDLLLTELALKRDVSRNPVFDTMFLYQNMDQPSSGGDSLTLKPVTVPADTAKFDISQEVFDTGTGAIVYSFEYATALFDENTIARMAGHFDTLLDRVLQNPKANISDISLLSVKEYEAQVFDFNDSIRDFDGQTVLDLVEGQVVQKPEAVAVIDGNEQLSYKTLNTQANSVALALRSSGLEKGDTVALYLDRSPELIVGILGVMKAGGVFLLIDTELPEKRVQYLLSHSRCQWALTSQAFTQQIFAWSENDVKVMSVEECREAYAAEEAGLAIDSTDQAYLLYTSGTTGHPKGVSVNHKALHNYISWGSAVYVGDGGGSFPLFTSISFDLTLTSIFTPLATGNAVVIYNDAGADREHSVIRALKDNQVDIIKLTPSHLRLLREVALPESGEIRLQKMILGGEALETKLAGEIFRKFKGRVSLFNEYGPTEATVGCMIHRFNADELSPTVPIGVPSANTQIYLLDKNLQLVPERVKGELYISGAGLASGYLFDETLSAEKFIPNPFTENGRLYKTGDLARRTPEGTIEYLGRVDEQVKINGYRIELDEINHHLRTYEGVVDSVVSPKEINGRKSLFAYLIAENGPISEAELKSHLTTSLPFYMLPARITCLKAFPMTGNGKIDHKALAAITIENEPEAVRLPANEIEGIFIDAWQSVLGLEGIATTDNFFELGGDSIKAVQIVSRLHENEISVQVKDILTYHTIAQLVANRKYAFLSPGARQGTVSGTKTKSPIESWFFNQQFANPSFYNQSVLLNINQALDIDRLENAFETIVAHHDGLRINYDTQEGTLFFNEDHLNGKFNIPVLELEENFLHQLSEVKSGFDISKSLLLKAAIIEEKGHQKHLFLTAHHLVTDGMSWRILLHDLSRVYAALEAGKEPALPRKTASLTEWQHALANWQPDNSKVSQQYWELMKQNSFKLPQDFSTENWSVSGLRQHVFHLGREHTEFLVKEAHKAYRTDVFTLLNVALVQTLHDWTGGQTFLIEHENHGRHLDELDVSRTLGWFTSMYPVLLAWIEGDLKAQIKAVKEQIRQVPDDGLSYGLEQQRTSHERTKKRTEIRFNYLGEFSLEDQEYWSFSGEPTGPETDPTNHLTTKMELNALVMNGQFTLEISYHQSLFKAETIQRIGSNYLSHLVNLLDHIRQEDDVHFTPSDFEAGLDQQELDELFIE
ncbi:MAG: plipastatin non-ribosomal peptide synthetase PpsC [Roseivirga sp.]